MEQMDWGKQPKRTQEVTKQTGLAKQYKVYTTIYPFTLKFQPQAFIVSIMFVAAIYGNKFR
jgi:hypothetical protein